MIVSLVLICRLCLILLALTVVDRVFCNRNLNGVFTLGKRTFYLFLPEGRKKIASLLAICPVNRI